MSAQEQVFSVGDTADFLYILESGRAKVYHSQNGEERIIRIAAEGAILGHRCLGQEFVFPVGACLLTPAKLLKIPLSVFQDTLQANPKFCYAFLLFMSEELKASEQHINDLTTMNVLQRIAKVLLINARIFGFSRNDKQVLSYTLSRKDLANFAGTTYESVIRCITLLEKYHILKSEKKNIRLLNQKKLENIFLGKEKIAIGNA